jgi:tetratricopeptide (TPR) repeat protein
MGALTIDQNLINAPGRFGLSMSGGVGVLVLLIALFLLANVHGRARFAVCALAVIGLLGLEIVLFLVRKQTTAFGEMKYPDDIRFWAFVGQISIPIAFALAARAMMANAYRRLHERVPVHIQAGIQHMFQREYAAAVQEFSAAIKIEPERAELYCKRGSAFELLGEHEMALADYERALTRDGRMMEVYLRRGTVRTARGDYVSALSDFDQVLSIRPNDVECHLQRGVCLSKNGRQRDAVVEFEKVLRLTNNPDYAEPARQALKDLGAGPNHSPH